MKVSVIIPTYNAEMFIDKCINSVKKQTFKNLEIIIVNDGSFDKTLELINEHLKFDQRIKVIDQVNMGVYLARARGIKESTGDAICFLDSDDYLELNAIELLVQEMIIDEADIVIANHYQIEKGRKRIEKNEIPKDRDNKISNLRFLLLGKIKGYPWGKLYKRHLLTSIDDPKEKIYFGEDIYLIFQILFNHKVKISLVDECILNYVIHTTNSVLSNDKKAVDGIFDHVFFVNEMLAKYNLTDVLVDELASYHCRTWVVYCRKSGEKSLDKEFFKFFYEEYYKTGKKYLPFYQKIEFLVYARNNKNGKLVTNLMKWIRNNLLT